MQPMHSRTLEREEEKKHKGFLQHLFRLFIFYQNCNNLPRHTLLSLNYIYLNYLATLLHVHAKTEQVGNVDITYYRARGDNLAHSHIPFLHRSLGWWVRRRISQVWEGNFNPGTCCAGSGEIMGGELLKAGQAGSRDSST